MSDLHAISPQELLAQTGSLRALARRLVADPDDADDLVQTAWLKAMTRPPRGPLGAWLWAVVRNEAAMLRRRTARRRRLEAGLPVEGAAPSAAETAARLGLHRRLIECVESLEPIYRQVVYLRWFDGLPPRAIAAQLDLPRRTVETRLRRALEKIRQDLDRRCGGRDPWVEGLLLFGWRGAASAPLWIGVFLMSKLSLVTGAVLVAGVIAFLAFGTGDPGAAPVPAPADPERPAPLTAASPATGSPPARSVLEGSPARTSDPGAAGSRLTGLVVDAGGAPTAGVGIRFEPEDGGRVVRGVSEEAGAFAVPEPAGPGAVRAEESGYTTLLAGVRNHYGEPVTVVVGRAAPVTGSVVHEDGSPVAGAELAVVLPEGFRSRFAVPLDHSEDGTWEARSGAGGLFSLADAPALAGCRLRVGRQDYAPTELALPPGARDLRIVLHPLAAAAGELRGRVVDAAGNQLPGSRVALGRLGRTTDPQGRFRFALTDPEVDTLFAVAEGRLPVLRRREEFAGGWPSYLEIQLTGEPLSISGVVLQPDGRPQGNARVWVQDLTYFGTTAGQQGAHRPPTSTRSAMSAIIPLAAEHTIVPGRRLWRTVETDDSGRFEIEGLLDRTYEVRALDDRALMVARTDVRAGTDGLVLQFPADGLHEVVTGRVIDRRGEGVPDLRIVVQRETFVFHSPEDGGMRFLEHASGAVARTDEDGGFRLEGVPRQGIHLSLQGADVMTDEHRFPDDRVPARFEIRVWRTCRVRVEVAGDLADADAFRLLDRHGGVLSMKRREPGRAWVEREATLFEGRSEILHVPDAAAEVVFLKDGAEIGRLPVHPDPERIVTVRG